MTDWGPLILQDLQQVFSKHNNMIKEAKKVIMGVDEKDNICVQCPICSKRVVAQRTGNQSKRFELIMSHVLTEHCPKAQEDHAKWKQLNVRNRKPLTSANPHPSSSNANPQATTSPSNANPQSSITNHARVSAQTPPSREDAEERSVVASPSTSSIASILDYTSLPNTVRTPVDPSNPKKTRGRPKKST